MISKYFIYYPLDILMEPLSRSARSIVRKLIARANEDIETFKKDPKLKPVPDFEEVYVYPINRDWRAIVEFEANQIKIARFYYKFPSKSNNNVMAVKSVSAQ